ncbi:isochorismatase family cysteine hydrolase, partial [Paraburkholderia unamae]
RSSSLSTSSAFGRPMAMLMSPVPLTSTCYANIDQLTTERDTSPSQRKIMQGHHFARGEWGGDWHPEFAPQPGDIVAQEHWGSSGFANTDLDFQLKQHGITHVVVVGLLANTCIEATARYATELGYHVTLVKDATAALKREMMHAVHELNGPTYAHSILSSRDLIAAIPTV